MTYEEAIKMLENSACSIAMEEAVDMAIEALEKQIPKKPVVDSGGVEPWYRCAVCGDLITTLHNKRVLTSVNRNHCMGCGQAILWEDTE